MHTEPTPLWSTRFRMASDDPAFSVRWRGGNRFLLQGEVEREPQAELELEAPHDAIGIRLARRSTPQHAVAKLRRALPRSLTMKTEVVTDGVELVFQEALVPAARLPRFRVVGSGLDFQQLDENKLEFLGATTGAGLVTICCDTRRVTIEVPEGCSAQSTATLIGAHVPHGFRALIDGPVVSVWKDADFFSAVA